MNQVAYPVFLTPEIGIRRTVRAGRSLQTVISQSRPYDVISVMAGDYAENVVIPATKHHLTIIGIGGRGSVAIEALTDGIALTNHAADVTLINIGAAGDGTGGGFLNTGRRLRTYGCKFEGGAFAAKMTLGTVAQIAALTRGKGDDCWLFDTEVAWATGGLVLEGTDYGAVTQPHVVGGLGHNCTKAIAEGVGAGGSAAVTFRNLTIDGMVFDRNEDGTEPTNYVDLNASNDNTGTVTDCAFPSDLDGGKNLVSTKLLWVANRHTDGISGAQPS